LWTQWVPVPRFGRPPLGWKPPMPPTGGRGRVPRIHDGPVAGEPRTRFGDPTRRILREGADGGIVVANQGARGEAGLGVPRGRVNLSTLPAPPTPGSRGFIDDQRDNRGLRSGRTGAPVSGRSSGSTSSPRPMPAPRMSPPPRAPSPAPRGSKGL
jgi:hypothetical protein